MGNQKRDGSRTVVVNGTVKAGTEGRWVHRGRGQRRAHQGDQLIRITVTGIQNGGEEEEMIGQRRVHLNLTGWRGRRKRRPHQRRRRNGTGTVMGVKEASRREGKGKREKKRGVQGTEMERTGKRAQA